jgi:hypothetical protein
MSRILHLPIFLRFAEQLPSTTPSEEGGKDLELSAEI